jgi:DNA-directed RNA polymerase subunit M/transcription elongation factor TFIIS
MKSKVKCPKCKSKDLFIAELWKDSAIEWEQRDGEIDRNDGNMSEGNPYRLQCKCSKCKHRWTLRGKIQIDEIEKD